MICAAVGSFSFTTRYGTSAAAFSASAPLGVGWEVVGGGVRQDKMSWNGWGGVEWDKMG